ncbi:MAG TPA: DUF6159 family protein [Conexibacter sp.]|nr:DUF6159 family protein [Conexibacter sp.]
MNRSGRFGRGWRLAKQSWAVLRADRTLALFPIISAVAIVAAALLIAGPGVVLLATNTAEPVAYVLWAIALYVLTYIGIYCSVALAAAADLALTGQDTKLSDGFSVARQRRGLVAKWAGVQLTVGLVLNLIESALSQSPLGRVVAGLVAGVLSAGWSILTFFVVPLLALEGVGPKDALQRSGHLIKERWGEGFVGSGSITGLLFLIVMLPSILVGALGVSMVGSSPAAGGVLIAVGVAGFVVGLLIASTLNAIFRVALYRYATQDAVVGGFDRDQFEHAFHARRSRF